MNQKKVIIMVFRLCQGAYVVTLLVNGTGLDSFEAYMVVKVLKFVGFDR